MTTENDMRKVEVRSEGYRDFAMAEKRGIKGWVMTEIFTLLEKEPTRDAKRSAVKELMANCKKALVAYDTNLSVPRANKRQRADEGAYADQPDQSDGEGGAKGTDDASDYRPPATQVLKGKSPAKQATSSSSSSDDEEQDQTPINVAPAQAKPVADLRLTTEEIEEVREPCHTINFPKEAKDVQSPAVKAMIDTLKRIKISCPPEEEALYQKVLPRLRQDAIPMEHQKHAARFMREAIREFRVAGNALECGLGKTFTTIMYTLYAAVLDDCPLALICGKAVLYDTWQQEIARVLPEGTYTIANIGPASFRSIEGGHTWKAGVVEPVMEGLKGGDVVFVYVQLHILNMPHGVLSLITELIEEVQGKATLIIEESHEQCRKHNVPCEAIGTLSRKCGRTVFISATPIMGDSGEAKHMLQMGNAHLPEDITHSDTLKLWREYCFREVKSTGFNALSTWFLRVPPTQGLGGMSGQAKDRAAVHGNGVEASEHPKFKAAAAAVLDMISHGEGVLVCVENCKGARDLQTMLKSSLGATKCLLLSGDTPEAERREGLEEVRRLHSTGVCSVVIATPQVGGAGLNLQSLSSVVLVGMLWTAQEMQQVIARVHRIGQTQACLCIVLVTGSGDQRVLTRVQEKMLSTAAFYGDRSGFVVAEDHIERIGVCAIEDVGQIVRRMRTHLTDPSTQAPRPEEGASPWSLFESKAA